MIAKKLNQSLLSKSLKHLVTNLIWFSFIKHVFFALIKNAVKQFFVQYLLFFTLARYLKQWELLFLLMLLLLLHLINISCERNFSGKRKKSPPTNLSVTKLEELQFFYTPEDKSIKWTFSMNSHYSNNKLKFDTRHSTACFDWKNLIFAEEEYFLRNWTFYMSKRFVKSVRCRRVF